jgi:hypothetical protein
MENYQILFLLNAFLVQLILIVHFTLRKWRFNLAMRYGPIVYALSIPSFILSIFLYNRGVGYSFWLGGIVYLVWAWYGFSVEYILRIEWRNSLRWPILVPYVILYLATVMFYWWPLALIYKPLWYVFAVLFLISTYLNVTSHKRSNSVTANEKYA